MSRVQQPPERLPADFFTKQHPPERLPANFFDNQPPPEDLGAIRRSQAEKFPTAKEGRQPVFKYGQPTTPENTRHLMGEFALGAFEQAGGDVESPILGTASNWTTGLWGFGKELARIGVTNDAQGAVELGKNLLLGLAEGPREVYQGAVSDDPERMAAGLGATVATVGEIVAGVKSPRAAAKVPGRARDAAANRATKLRGKSATNMERALQPKTLDHKGITQRIAPELATRGHYGSTGPKFDKSILDAHARAGRRVRFVESQINATTTVNTRGILERIDDAANDLSVPSRTPGETVSFHDDAIKALQEQRAKISALPDEVPFRDLLKIRRQLDKAIRERGGFKETAASADKVKTQVLRGVADLVRNELGDVSPALRKANREYNLYRAAHDIVTRRNLSEVGISDSWMHGLGRISDDLVASYIGFTVAGPGGAIALETANLMRQGRGVRSITAALQNASAKRYERLFPRPKLPPRKMLPERAGGPFAMPEP